MPSDFMSRLSAVESIIWSYARHYEISGILDAEDLYQEGLLELDVMCNSDEYKELPKTTFSVYLKTRLTSRFLRKIRYHTRQKRDWRNTVDIDNIESIVESKMDQGVVNSFSIDKTLFDAFYPDPSVELEQQQKIDEAKRFIDEVNEGLDDEAQWLFEQLLIGEVPESVKKEFQRVPGHASVTVLGLIFAWDRGKTWRVWKRVRKRAEFVIRKNMRLHDSLLWNESNTKHIFSKKRGSS